ncbi:MULTISPECIES: SDR family oxidoreductase [unclassified Microbacterium]|uniref:SDR family NAD(P)-dependent oxidoreductase n=1 Tax=unclassified Microbacterium TaxID=2609290 RepID=UPI000C2BDD11|nr:MULTISPECIES: SDR family oxidoreductase [unclassified Microbacterium]
MPIDFTATTALITGASSGIGAAFADALAARGADVVLIARREDRLIELASELSDRHGITATPIAMDLARTEAATELRDELEARGIRIDTLINNAGFGMRGDFIDADPARVATMIQVNVTTLVALTHAFLPALVASGRGALVNVSSVVAYQPTPHMAVYGASKAFVLSFTEAIAYETRASGLRVLAISPGATATEFFEIAQAEDMARGRVQTPAQVVANALRALDRRRTPPSIVSGGTNAVAATLAGIMPRGLVLDASGRLLA